MYAAGRGLHHRRDWCPVSADRFASSARWFVVQTEDVGDWASGVLPVGTVTFLLTDVEGSTRLWEANQDETAAAIARHYEILDAAVGAAGGVRPVEQGEGDSIVAAFATAKDALAGHARCTTAIGRKIIVAAFATAKDRCGPRSMHNGNWTRSSTGCRYAWPSTPVKRSCVTRATTWAVPSSGAHG